MTLYDQMKENIEKNWDLVVSPAPPIVDCKRMQELRKRMYKLCIRIKRKYGLI